MNTTTEERIDLPHLADKHDIAWKHLLTGDLSDCPRLDLFHSMWHYFPIKATTVGMATAVYPQGKPQWRKPGPKGVWLAMGTSTFYHPSAAFARGGMPDACCAVFQDGKCVGCCLTYEEAWDFVVSLFVPGKYKKQTDFPDIMMFLARDSELGSFNAPDRKELRASLDKASRGNAA